MPNPPPALPIGEAGAKVGLDDYLCAHPVATLDELPRLPLKHPRPTVRRS